MIKYAKNLLEWNKKNLTHKSILNEQVISQVFAENFTVIANGRKYAANYKNYLEFLNGFRKTIKSIDYDVQEFICEDNKVIFPLTATIIRTNQNTEKYNAMLLLKFNQQNQIYWWQEVYGIDS